MLFVDPKCLKNTEHQLHLIFLSEFTENNLCYINQNTQIRDDYKQYFNLNDWKNYIISIVTKKNIAINEAFYFEADYPTSNNLFWSETNRVKNKNFNFEKVTFYAFHSHTNRIVLTSSIIDTTVLECFYQIT